MRGPTASQRESAEPGVDAFYLAVRWRPRLASPACLRHDRRCDGARPTVATFDRRRSLAVNARSRRRADDGLEARRRPLPGRLGVSGDGRVHA